MEVYLWNESHCKKEDEIREFCLKTANAEKIIEYISLRKGKQINQVTIYPMTFDEFLMNSNKMLYDAAKKAYESKQLLEKQIHELAMEQVYKYLLIGGCIALSRSVSKYL